MPGQEVVVQKDQSKPGKGLAENRLNVRVAELSSEQRNRLSLDKHGVLVEVVIDGPAADSGILPGDIILLLDNKKVIDASKLKGLSDSLPAGKAVPILIQREGNPCYPPQKGRDHQGGLPSQISGQEFPSEVSNSDKISLEI